MELIQNADIKNKTVFLRVDFNVPLEDGRITDNNRIKAAIPTIKFLVESRAKVIIGTHLGRPEGKRSEETSIEPVARELQRLLNLKVRKSEGFELNTLEREVKSLLPGGILVLENLRWDPREEENNREFGKELSCAADIYVNDAFAVSHRANASVEAITHFLPSYAGLLLQSELEHLSSLRDKPRHPFVLIVGGAKVADKAPVIREFADKVNLVLVGGAVGNTFLKAQGIEISKSLFEDDMVLECKEIIKLLGKKLILPVDWIKKETSSGFEILDIGIKTRQLFVREITKAKTVLWNGNLGQTEQKEYSEGTRAIAIALNQINGKSVVAGGDTVGFLKQNGLDRGITFVSTGGGAALEFLAGEKLPGIAALG